MEISIYNIDVEYRTEDGRNAVEKLWLFDFNNPENNNFLAVNQFTVIEGQSNKRPVVFVNGLLLVVIELKNSTDEAAGITEAFHQLQTYKSTIPSLFNYNSFLVTRSNERYGDANDLCQSQRIRNYPKRGGRVISSYEAVRIAPGCFLVWNSELNVTILSRCLARLSCKTYDRRKIQPYNKAIIKQQL